MKNCLSLFYIQKSPICWEYSIIPTKDLLSQDQATLFPIILQFFSDFAKITRFFGVLGRFSRIRKFLLVRDWKMCEMLPKFHLKIIISWNLNIFLSNINRNAINCDCCVAFFLLFGLLCLYTFFGGYEREREYKCGLIWDFVLVA